MSRAFFRAMLADTDRLPTVGDQRNMLGVRPAIDLKAAGAGPGLGGLSVTADDPARMTPGVLPRAFGGLNAETVMFETPEATFDAGSGLTIGEVHVTKRHAVVEASAPCTIEKFQILLARTRPRWIVTPVPPLEAP